jgi:hemolysin activation/secretion protein
MSWTTLKGIFCVGIVLCVFCASSTWAAEEVAAPVKGKAADAQAKDKGDGGERISRSMEQMLASLPADTTPKFQIGEIRISGNVLLSSEDLLEKIPLVYDASPGTAKKLVSDYLYDLRGIKKIAAGGGAAEVSARSIQGFTRYLLSVYEDEDYAGIYVYVPSDAFGEGKDLKEGILPVKVIEAKVVDVRAQSFDVDGAAVEKGYLRHSALLGWSPAKEGEVANKKKMDDMLGLLNRNPDRYMSAVVSKGSEPESLSVGYNVYEANPWHFFAQVDNAGTKDRRWTPRVGMINTDTLGFDDILTLIYQTPVDGDLGDQYSLYGSYDFPLVGPRLRLNLFGGYSEFDVSGSGDISFLGRGSFHGGTVRFNVMQANEWFFDVTGTLMHQESKITPSLFPSFLKSDVDIDLWGMGVEIYRESDMSDTRIAFQRFDSYDGSRESGFGLARTGAKRDFSILSATVNHSQFLDTDKIQNLSGSFKYISADERLHPSQMTTFGGMYSVRGYDEYEIVADGGVLASVQYEYDLVKREQAKRRAAGRDVTEKDRKPFVRKFAPLVFLDYGQARIVDALSTETTDQELCSWGAGAKLELGDNFTGVIYYGYPLIRTAETREGKGRINVGFLWRF